MHSKAAKGEVSLPLLVGSWITAAVVLGSLAAIYGGQRLLVRPGLPAEHRLDISSSTLIQGKENSIVLKAQGNMPEGVRSDEKAVVKIPELGF
jgi:hypothetical protein